MQKETHQSSIANVEEPAVLFQYQNDEAGRMPVTRMRAGVRFAAFLGRRLITRATRFSLRFTIKRSRRARRLLIAANMARREYYVRRRAAMVRLITRVTRFSLRSTIKRSRRARRLLIAANMARHPWEYYVRRRAAMVRARDTDGVTIGRTAGFARFNESDFEKLLDIVRLCQHIYVDEKREMVKAPPKSTAKQKRYLVELLTDEDLGRYPLLVDFCLSRPVVAVVSRYLGTVPVLRRVGLWLSFPAPINGASRLFHLDPEDFRQVRMFVNVIDISKPQGPLTFLPGDLSEKVLTQLWRDERRAGIRRPEYRRWTDEEIFARSGSAECFDLAGPEGSGVFLDTARCLHFGSRMEPGTMRLVFHAQFLPYHFAYSCSANRFDRARAGGDAMRSRLLAQRPGMPVIAVAGRTGVDADTF